MSSETRTWLSENTLIGFTDKRGSAWHYREGDDNHYPGAIPIEDVHRRLFDWTAEEHPVYVETGRDTFLHVPDRKAIVRSDTGHVMGLFKSGYQPHQYGEWLVQNVEAILDRIPYPGTITPSISGVRSSLDDSLSIGSAGLLKSGAVAWVSVEMPETIITPEGVAFRPNLLACTSFDGSVATTYKRVVTNVVCDNTMSAALGEGGGQMVKVKHSANSLGRLQSARDALGVVYGIADDFAAEVKALCDIDVSDRLWDKILDKIAPMPEGEKPSSRAVTLSEKKRDELTRLWNHDERVTPWHGTAFGVWQAYNTYQHHSGIVRGASRPERNMLRAVDGTAEAADADAMGKVLDLV